MNTSPWRVWWKGQESDSVNEEAARHRRIVRRAFWLFAFSALFTFPLFLQMIWMLLGFRSQMPGVIQGILATIVQLGMGWGFYKRAYRSIKREGGVPAGSIDCTRDNDSLPLQSVGLHFWVKRESLFRKQRDDHHFSALWALVWVLRNQAGLESYGPADKSSKHTIGKGPHSADCDAGNTPFRALRCSTQCRDLFSLGSLQFR